MNLSTRTKRRPPAVVEVVFDVTYLILVLTAGIVLHRGAVASPLARLFGAMCLLLGGGDAFHLLPRIHGQWTSTMADHTRSLGFGKLVTSLTMTLFYLLLYFVWEGCYLPGGHPALRVWVCGLSVLRVTLCLFPQNRWLHRDAPISWAIARNLPFAALGATVALLFATSAAAGDPFHWMPLAILLSFGFYLPVVLYSQKYPMVGMLMLPKTCAYLWMVTMGLSLR